MTDDELDRRVSALSDDDVRELAGDRGGHGTLAWHRPLAARQALAREVLRLRAAPRGPAQSRPDGTAWTHDIPPGDVGALLDRLRSCDGTTHDCTVLVWKQAQALVAEVDRLRTTLADSEAQVRALVPLGDISGVPEWARADAAYRERIASLEKALRRIQAACGIPDAHDACRAVLGLAAEALEGGK